MANKKYNIKTSVVAGLVDNYSVFNLRRGETNDTTDAYHNIKIQVFIDGKEYIENTETTIVHAGESVYKVFEGILPTLQDSLWDVNKYGENLTHKLKQYIEIPNTTIGLDIYSSPTAYTDYKNQFNIEFKDSENSDIYKDNDTFITYKLELDTLLSKRYFDRTLESLSGESSNNYLYLNVAIVHFSKYYNIYSNNTTKVPQLTPLIQTEEDLYNYGLGINDTDIYINTIWGHKHWAGKNGGSDHTYFDNRLYSYDPSSKAYLMDSYFADLGNRFDPESYNVSMFKSNYWGANTFRKDIEEKWELSFPKGFAVFGIENESSVHTSIHSKNTSGMGDENQTYLSNYKNIYKCHNYKYNFEDKLIRDYLNETTIAQVALAYYADSNGNPHIFNSWFPVKRTGKYENSEKIYQEIQYKSGQEDKRPKTLGIIVASLLANIYIYKDDASSNIGYVSDIVYLGVNTTLFVKDIVFKTRSLVESKIEDGFTKKTNGLLLFNFLNYLEYLSKVKENATNGKESIINNTNVNVTLKLGIKNVPLLFNVNYKEPNTDILNLKDSQIIIKKITGESFLTHKSDIIQHDRLYQLTKDSDGNETVEYLGPNFIINFIKNPTLDGPNFKAEWDTNVTPEKNEYIYEMFKIEGGIMIPSISRAINRYGYYYSIGTKYKYNNAVKDLIRSEVILPSARIL